MTEQPKPEKQPEKQDVAKVEQTAQPVKSDAPAEKPVQSEAPKPDAANSSAAKDTSLDTVVPKSSSTPEKPPTASPTPEKQPVASPSTRDISEILKEITAKDATLPSKGTVLNRPEPAKDDTQAAPKPSAEKVTEHLPPTPSAPAAPPPAAGTAVQVCPTCGHRNRPGTLVCDNCGTNLMTGSRAAVGTRDLVREQEKEKEAEKPGERLLDTSESRAIETAGATTFTEDMVLRIEIEGGTTPMLVYPKQEIIMGRRDPNTGGMPDVDLTAYAGYRMGVSRRHAAIRLQDRHLNVSDLGSSNGTFLNGTRLNAHRPYQLRDGDEIRVGQMVLRVYFQSSKDRKG